MVKTLKISNETHTMLCQFGNKEETFDEIIKRLILLVREDEETV